MAKGGKHIAENSKTALRSGKKSGGAHAVSRKGKNSGSFGISVKGKHSKPKFEITPANIIKALILLLICFVMISPMKSCLLSDSDYIGISTAEKLALADAGIPTEKVADLKADLIKIDGEAYYKVQFTGTVTDYRYILDASTGDIVARSFYHIDGEN